MTIGPFANSVEAERQQALVAALRSPQVPSRETGLEGTDARIGSGWSIYRANGKALAERALSAAFPTLRALLGPADFEQLAHEHWRDAPPSSGDIGEWGAEVAPWIERHVGLAQWPYLADCARLDWLCHRCERAADAQRDAGSLALLENRDPASLRLELQPGLDVLASRWPVATLFELHQFAPGAPAARTAKLERPASESGAADNAAWQVAREAIAERRRECVLVARNGWRAAAQRIDSAQHGFTSDLLQRASLGAALERAGPGFDFTQWLARAVGSAWLVRVVSTAE